jgi:hypothetical protein
MDTTRDIIATDKEIQLTSEALQASGFTVQIVGTKEEAHRAVLDLIPKGSGVFTNTSATLDETGLAEVLNGPDYVSARNKMMALYGNSEKKKEMKQVASTPDISIGSVHAVTKDGSLLIASATGSQIPGEAFGADKVIFVVGAQKLVGTLSDGVTRIKEVVMPLEDKRAMAAYGSHTAFNKLLVINGDMPGRITVILVKESLGF